jgi:hypothetical protein
MAPSGGGYTKTLDSYLKLKDILKQEPDRHSGTVLVME